MDAANAQYAGWSRDCASRAVLTATTAATAREPDVTSNATRDGKRSRASAARPRQPQPFGGDRAQADRRVDRHADDEHAVERGPRERCRACARGSRPRSGRRAPRRSSSRDARRRTAPAPPRSPAARATAALVSAARAHSSPLSTARAVARFSPAIDAVGESCFGQRSVHALLRVAGVAAGVAGDRGEALGPAAVAHVVDERPRAVERRRTEIRRIPRHDVARSRSRRRSRCIRSPRRPRGAPAMRARRARNRRGASPSARTGLSPAPTCRRTRACR